MCRTTIKHLKLKQKRTTQTQVPAAAVRAQPQLEPGVAAARVARGAAGHAASSPVGGAVSARFSFQVLSAYAFLIWRLKEV